MAFLTTAGSMAPSLASAASAAYGDGLCIHFEEVAECCATLAAAEPVGAERRQRTRQPPIDGIGQRLHVIGRRDDGAFGAAEALGHIGHARLFAGCSRFQRSTAWPSRYSSW